MFLLPSIHPTSEVKKITSFIKKTLKASKFTQLIVATSGGIDSSTTLALAAQAIGSQNVYALRLPYRASSSSLASSDLAIKHAQIPPQNVLTANISPLVDSVWKTVLIPASKSPTDSTQYINQVRLGNIMARTRMILLFDTAKALQTLVCGTENRSEHLLGYFTRFGDAASDLEPLQHVYKTHVRQLANHLKLPQPILDQSPTAGLWLDQTDEAELGFTYTLADQILYLTFDKKLPPNQIAIKLLKSAQAKTKTEANHTVKKVLTRVHSSNFKHHLPYHLVLKKASIV